MRTIDKIDVVEALADVLDDTRVDGLGLILANPDSEEWGTLILQTFPVEGQPSEDFRVRVTRIK